MQEDMTFGSSQRRRHYDPMTRAKVKGRLETLDKAGLNSTELGYTMRKEGFTDPCGTRPISSNTINRYLTAVRKTEAKLAKAQVPTSVLATPAPTQAKAPVPDLRTPPQSAQQDKIVRRGTILSILDDPGFSDAKKIELVRLFLTSLGA